MRIESFSQSKYRDGAVGDDIFSIAVDEYYGVFDGATDATSVGSKSNGKLPPGRFAALSVSRFCTSYFAERKNRLRPLEHIVNSISSALLADKNDAGYKGASTTLSIVLVLEDGIRYIAIGDSSLRVNGDTIHCCEKLVDKVATAARVEIFNRVSEQIEDLDQAELLTRQYIFGGLHMPPHSDLLSENDTTEIIDITANKFASLVGRDVVSEFLNSGICSQYRFANNPEHPFGFSALDGSIPMLRDIIDLRFSHDEIETIELFTDGYVVAPDSVSIAEWEATHARVEASDFHRKSIFPAVKGNTSREAFDDRTVVIVKM